MEFKDQMNKAVRLSQVPNRIVSLVPSQTELLHYFGLDKEVVGITKFCIHPDEWFRSKKRVGGTKNIDFNKVNALEPDLIIGNKEENAKVDIERLEANYPVWMSDIFTLDDACEMIANLGEITGRKSVSEDLICEIQAEFEELSHEKLKIKENKVVYLIWNEPAITVGSNTFIDDMLERCGFENMVTEERYPELHHLKAAPDFVFLSSEPFPFNEKHIEDFQHRFPSAKIILVDGEYFSWYGSRLKEAPAYFRTLLQECRKD